MEIKTVRIEEHRRKKKVLQKEMADMLGLSERQYRRIEKGVCSPDPWEAIKIADKLGVKDLRLLWSCSST